MKIFLFIQKERKKKNKSKELLAKHHSQMMIITQYLFNIGYIITYTQKLIHKPI